MVSLTREEGHQLAKRIQEQGNRPWTQESVYVPRSVPTASGSTSKQIFNPARFKPTIGRDGSLAKLDVVANNHRKEVLFSDEPDVNKVKVKEAWATSIIQLPHGERPTINITNLRKFAKAGFTGINITELVDLHQHEMIAFVNGKHRSMRLDFNQLPSHPTLTFIFTFSPPSL